MRGLLIACYLLVGAPASCGQAREPTNGVGAQLVSPEAFDSRLARAKPGDKLLLGPGAFGDLILSKRDGIAIEGTKQSVFSSVQITRSTSISLSGVTIRMVASAQSTSQSRAVSILGSKGVQLSSLLIEGQPAISGIAPDSSRGTANPSGLVIGLPFGQGVRVFRSENVTLATSEIRGFKDGVAFLASPDGRILDNDIHDLRATPIIASASPRIEIARNHAWRSRPWQFGGAGDHGDFIHVFNRAGQSPDLSRSIRIRDNLWEQRDGTALLGIYIDDNKLGIGFADAVVTGNVVINSNGQGIRLENVSGLVADNVLLASNPKDWREHPRIRVLSGSKVTLRGNRAAQVDTEAGTSTTGVVNNLSLGSALEATQAVNIWRHRFR